MRSTETPTSSQNMAATTGKQSIKVLWLFQIDAPGGTLYFAQSTANVSYLGQTWISWPIEHNGLDENAKGKISQPTVNVGNINEDISALLELNDGLRGVCLHVYQVIDVTDSAAYLEDSYQIDSVKVGYEAASFTLSTAMQIQNAQIAPRMFNRTFCYWTYKGRGCWYFGTMNSTSGSSRIVGIKTVWQTGPNPVQVGDQFVIWGDTNLYFVSSVQDDTHLTLTANCGSNNTNVQCTISNPANGAIRTQLPDTWQTGGSDTCGKTASECLRHNNTQRFGAFPAIPTGIVMTGQ